MGLLNATQMLLLTEPLALKQIVYIHKHSLILSYRISIGHGINEDMVVVSLRSASWLSHLAMLQNMRGTVLLGKWKARSRLVLFALSILHWMCLATNSGGWQPKHLESGQRAWEGEQEEATSYIYNLVCTCCSTSPSVAILEGWPLWKKNSLFPRLISITAGQSNHSLLHWLVMVQIGTVQPKHVCIFTQLKLVLKWAEFLNLQLKVVFGEAQWKLSFCKETYHILLYNMAISKV